MGGRLVGEAENGHKLFGGGKGKQSDLRVE